MNIAILTVSDTRTKANDTSGDTLATLTEEDGHKLLERELVIDNIYKIRAIVSQWIANESIHSIITTGGTGFYPKDITPEAITPLLDKKIEGFGELFRSYSEREIGTSTIQSRAFGGIANSTAIFCLPGSTGGCSLGWKSILSEQLNSQTKPCNFVKPLTNTL